MSGIIVYQMKPKLNLINTWLQPGGYGVVLVI